mgnify:CR=1 FL=1
MNLPITIFDVLLYLLTSVSTATMHLIWALAMNHQNSVGSTLHGSAQYT